MKIHYLLYLRDYNGICRAVDATDPLLVDRMYGVKIEATFPLGFEQGNQEQVIHGRWIPILVNLIRMKLEPEMREHT